MQALNARFPTALPHSEATLDAPSQPSLSSACEGEACRVQLVQGSDSGRTGETEDLLCSRLRSASLLMFAGFAAFLVWHTIRIEFDSSLRVSLYAAHFATTLIVAAIGFSLCTACPMTARQLRWIELATFGVPLLFFVLLQYEKSVLWTDQFGVLPEVAPCWLVMIFTYALFIPNTWQRAAAVIAAMAVAPLVAIVVTARVNADAGALLTSDSRLLVETFLILALATVSAAFGVRTINSLRDEALRA